MAPGWGNRGSSTLTLGQGAICPVCYSPCSELLSLQKPWSGYQVRQSRNSIWSNFRYQPLSYIPESFLRMAWPFRFSTYLLIESNTFFGPVTMLSVLLPLDPFKEPHWWFSLFACSTAFLRTSRAAHGEFWRVSPDHQTKYPMTGPTAFCFPISSTADLLVAHLARHPQVSTLR